MDPQIHEDIPVDKAWREGRRVYVKTGYKTELNDNLRELGAKWDPGAKALWIGSGKLEKVVPLVLAGAAKAAAVQAVKDRGHWVSIPYDATDIREQAKRLGAKWDGALKMWALPDAESLATIRATVTARRDAWKAADEAAKRAGEDYRESVRKQDAERARVDKAESRRRAIATSGRVATGEEESVTIVSTRRMNKATARGMAEPIGSIMGLDDGRRGLVVAVEVWFTDDEMASSVCWHAETHDMAHWDIRHELLIVAPTEKEKTADAERQAVREDAIDIHRLVRDAGTLTGSRTEDRWTPIPEDEQAGSIEVHLGTPGTAGFSGGRLILATDGRVVWQHPGYYDDYIRSEGITSDPEVVERVRAVLARGDRERSVHGQLTTTYTVKGADA